jgi:hypothetical protein
MREVSMTPIMIKEVKCVTTSNTFLFLPFFGYPTSLMPLFYTIRVSVLAQPKNGKLAFAFSSEF